MNVQPYTRPLLTKPRILLVILMAFIFAIFSTFFAQTSFAASPISLNQCNDVDNTGGLNTTCDVTVVNNLNLATGVTSSTTTVKECHGAAGAAPTCVTTPSSSTDLVTSVNQCNGSTNGGGGQVDCSVTVTTNVTGKGTPTAATVNQCNDSGTGGGIEPTTLCDPTGSTTAATVTQCNGSGNGGGGSERVTCNVTDSVVTPVAPVNVNQCNGSGSGGGGTVTCDTRLQVNFLAVVVTPPTSTPTASPTGSPSSSPSPTVTPKPTSTPTKTSSPSPTSTTSSSPVAGNGSEGNGPKNGEGNVGTSENMNGNGNGKNLAYTGSQDLIPLTAAGFFLLALGVGLIVSRKRGHAVAERKH